jgi:hypothetical protein
MNARSLLREARSLRRPAHVTVSADPVEFCRETLNLVPDGWQAEVLTSNHPRKVLCCCRQSGKTTTAAVLALHKAITQPGSTTLIVAPGERQAKLLFSKAARLYRQAGAPVPATSDRRTGMEFANGSIIEALPAVERTTRGYSVDLLLVEEAAGVPDNDYFGLLPTIVATGGHQILLSTPRGKRGFFSEIFHDQASGFEKTMITADETPRITEDGLEVFRRSPMPEEWFRQEFYCEFLDAEGSLFSVDDIEAALAAGEDLEAIHLEGDSEW